MRDVLMEYAIRLLIELCGSIGINPSIIRWPMAKRVSHKFNVKAQSLFLGLQMPIRY